LRSRSGSSKSLAAARQDRRELHRQYRDVNRDRRELNWDRR
jgi:hypothetical protein